MVVSLLPDLPHITHIIFLSLPKAAIRYHHRECLLTTRNGHWSPGYWSPLYHYKNERPNRSSKSIKLECKSRRVFAIASQCTTVYACHKTGARISADDPYFVWFQPVLSLCCGVSVWQTNRLNWRNRYALILLENERHIQWYFSLDYSLRKHTFDYRNRLSVEHWLRLKSIWSLRYANNYLWGYLRLWPRFSKTKK